MSSSGLATIALHRKLPLDERPEFHQLLVFNFSPTSMLESTKAIVRLGESPGRDLGKHDLSYGYFPHRTTVTLELADLLPQFGIKGKLADQLTSFSRERLDLLNCTPGYGFNVHTQAHEGRGIYMLDAGPHGAIYLKGCGAPNFKRINPSRKSSFDDELDTLPAFALGEASLTFGEKTLHRPRLFGALSHKGAISELVIATAKLAAVIERYGITSIEQLFLLHQPIPIGTGRNQSVSDALKRAVLAYHVRSSEGDAAAKAAVHACEDYGMVACWFPSNKRVGPVRPVVNALNSSNEIYYQGYRFADALCWDLAIGWWPTDGSGHLQNAVMTAPHAFTARMVDFSDQFPLHFAAAIMEQQEPGHTFECCLEAIVASTIYSLCQTFDHEKSSRAIRDIHQYRTAILAGFLDRISGEPALAIPFGYGLNRDSEGHLAFLAVDGQVATEAEFYGSCGLLGPCAIGLARYIRQNLAIDYGMSNNSRLAKVLRDTEGTDLRDHVNLGLGGTAAWTKRVDHLGETAPSAEKFVGIVCAQLTREEVNEPERQGIASAAVHNNLMTQLSFGPIHGAGGMIEDRATRWLSKVITTILGGTTGVSLADLFDAQQLAYIEQGFKNDQMYLAQQCIGLGFTQVTHLCGFFEQVRLKERLGQLFRTEINRPIEPYPRIAWAHCPPRTSLVAAASTALNSFLTEQISTRVSWNTFSLGPSDELAELLQSRIELWKNCTELRPMELDELHSLMQVLPLDSISLQKLAELASLDHPTPGLPCLIGGLENLAGSLPNGSLRIADVWTSDLGDSLCGCRSFLLTEVKESDRLGAVAQLIFLRWEFAVRLLTDPIHLDLGPEAAEQLRHGPYGRQLFILLLADIILYCRTLSGALTGKLDLHAA